MLRIPTIAALARLAVSLPAPAGAPLSDADSTAELVFRQRRLKARDEAVASTCIVLALGYHLCSLLTDRFFVALPDRRLFTMAHLSLASLHLLWLLKVRHRQIDVRWYLWPLQVVFVCFMALILSRTIGRGNPADVILAATGLTILAAVMLLLCPFHN